MASFTLNAATSYAIWAMEKISPSIRDFRDNISEDMTQVMEPFNRDGAANAKAISDLVLHAMQPIKYLFWSSAVLTCANYLAAKYTPIFSSIFKVTTVISAFFTFDLFMTYCHAYKEFYYFDARSYEQDPHVQWGDFLKHVDDYSRSILASTFLLSSSRFLSKDVNGGLVTLLSAAKDANSTPSAQDVIDHLPGISRWFRVAQEYLH